MHHWIPTVYIQCPLVDLDIVHVRYITFQPYVYIHRYIIWTVTFEKIAFNSKILNDWQSVVQAPLKQLLGMFNDCYKL